MKLHLLNCSGKFDDYLQMIKTSFDKSVHLISDLLEIDKVDVVVQYSKHAIPETGIVGFSSSANIAYMFLDPDNINFKNSFDLEFLAMLGHELHHCMRYRGPGYGENLKDAIISEGLACNFETELRNGSVPFYAANLEADTFKKLFNRMKSELESNQYDHNAWFLGSKEKEIPRHTGYKIGFNIVNEYITNTGIPASQLWSKPTSLFLP